MIEVDMMPSPPIPGAPEGLTYRACDCESEFLLVRRFAGIETWQCLTCRKVSEVTTRPPGEKTCLHCGKALKGRQSGWCSDEHGREFAEHKNRWAWAKRVKRRDNYTCQRCGWFEADDESAAYQKAWNDVVSEHPGWMMQRIEAEAHRRSGLRRLEAHHVHPIEYGGAEFDPENGITLCNLCHDEEHRALAEMGMPVGGKRRKKTG